MRVPARVRWHRWQGLRLRAHGGLVLCDQLLRLRVELAPHRVVPCERTPLLNRAPPRCA